jgi:hypothetical protein
MLNIGVNINVDLKETQYPIYFEKRNICVHCGAEGTLTFVDKFGKETNKEIYPFDHIKCKKCNATYSILWQRDESNNNRMYPTAVDHSINKEFLNTIKYPFIKDKLVKSIE